MSDKKPIDAYDQTRLRYWNENYVQYWKARVAEANAAPSALSAMVTNDAATTGDVRYLQAISILGITRQNSVLELGCGFGRSLPVLSGLAAEVAAVDISEQMIEVAKRDFAADNINFHVSPSEDLPFDANKFDRILCFAAFDAMYQTEALKEMHRVCKPGGLILLTGKNDNYQLDDIRAYNAELGAQKKGHPNYFTDVKRLVNDLGSLGFGLVYERYYAYRGDFSKGLAKTKMPDFFYEYMIAIKKIGAASAKLSNKKYESPVSKSSIMLADKQSNKGAQ